MLLDWIMHCIQLTTVIINTAKLGMSLQDNKGSSRATLSCFIYNVHVWKYTIMQSTVFILMCCIFVTCRRSGGRTIEEHSGRTSSAASEEAKICYRSQSQRVLQFHNVILMLTHAHTKHLRQHTYLLCVTHYFRYDTCTCTSNVNVFALLCLISIVPHYIHDCLSLVHTDIAVRI